MIIFIQYTLLYMLFIYLIANSNNTFVYYIVKDNICS